MKLLGILYNLIYKSKHGVCPSVCHDKQRRAGAGAGQGRAGRGGAGQGRAGRPVKSFKKKLKTTFFFF
jgi:hypothetical protein